MKDGSTDALAPFQIYFTPYGEKKTEIVELKDHKYRVSWDGKSSLRVWKAWYENGHYRNPDVNTVGCGYGCLLVIASAMLMLWLTREVIRKIL